MREILLFPDPRLRQKCREVKEINQQIIGEINELENALDRNPGCVGIAAPQLGFDNQIILIAPDRQDRVKYTLEQTILINPKILTKTGQEIGREGCLSIPNYTANIKRAKLLSVEYLSIEGEIEKIEVVDFEARLLSHEIDHLHGVLFFDHIQAIYDDIFVREVKQA